MPRLEWTDNHAMGDVSKKLCRQPLEIIMGSNNINKETSSTTTRGEKSIGVDRNGSDVVQL